MNDKDEEMWYDNPSTSTDAFKSFTNQLNDNWDKIDDEFGIIVKSLRNLAIILGVVIIAVLVLTLVVVFK